MCTSWHFREHSARFALASAAILLVAGCSNGIKTSGAWVEPRPASVPYQHVLVVGVSPESRMRRSLEQQLTATLNGSGTTRATASMFVASEMNVSALSRDVVIAMVRKTGADAVLVTRMVGATATADKSKEEAILKFGTTVTVDEQPGMTTVWVSDFNLSDVPAQLEANADLRVESTLYDVADRGRLVYRIAIDDEVENVRADIIPDIAGDLAATIAGQLRNDGVVR